MSSVNLLRQAPFLPLQLISPPPLIQQPVEPALLMHERMMGNARLDAVAFVVVLTGTVSTERSDQFGSFLLRSVPNDDERQELNTRSHSAWMNLSARAPSS